MIGCAVPVYGDAHEGQAFLDDCVRTCRSKSQYLHIQGVPVLSTMVTGIDKWWKLGYIVHVTVLSMGSD